MSGKNPYYPNNWDMYKEADDEDFIPHTFEEVMTWKVANWELPSSVQCIIRVRDYNKNKIKEYVYQQRAAAERKVAALCNTPNVEFTVCTDKAIHFITQRDNDDADD